MWLGNQNCVIIAPELAISSQHLFGLFEQVSAGIATIEMEVPFFISSGDVMGDFSEVWNSKAAPSQLALNEFDVLHKNIVNTLPHVLTF